MSNAIWHRLTHGGRVTHICISKLTIMGSDNGLSPGRRQAIIWTNAIILLIGPLGTNFSEILCKIHAFSFKKIHMKMSSTKWQQFCLGLSELALDIWICIIHLDSYVLAMNFAELNFMLCSHPVQEVFYWRGVSGAAGWQQRPCGTPPPGGWQGAIHWGIHWPATRGTLGHRHTPLTWGTRLTCRN